jgi:hypothetical protein
MEAALVDIAISPEIEKYVAKVVENRLQQAIEEFSKRNEIRLKELSLIERVVRVEKELKSLRETLEVKFDAFEKRFEAFQREMNTRFEALQREMNARFEAVDKRFEAMDKRFSVIQWMIGIFVGIPALIIAIIEVLGVLK